MIFIYGIIVLLAVAIVFFLFIYVAPSRALELGLNATRKQAGLRRKKISISNELHFSYLEGGRGEPLLLLHGFGGNKDTFARVSRYLVKHYRVIIPDIVGFGESTHQPYADYSPPAQVKRLRAFLQALDIKSVHVGGNSMGGQIALVFAALYPAQVNSLWLLSPLISKNSFKRQLLDQIGESGKNPLIATSVKEFQEVMALGMKHPPYVPKPMLKLLAQERIDNAVLERHIFKQILDYSISERLGGLATPCLTVFGNQDRVIATKTANVIKNSLADVRLVFIQGVGHVPMFEKPRQCALDYISFRESLADLSPLCAEDQFYSKSSGL